MIIEKYIRQLLFQHDCVVIPDFGGFIAKYAAATIHPVRHTFLPPSKEVAFNEMLRLNDGLLISHVAVGERISREQATKLVKDFAEYVRGQIWQNQKYTFEEIGTLSLNPEQKMEFEPILRINYLNAGYGLPDMSFKPIERNTYQSKVRTKDRLPIPQTASETAEPGLIPAVFRRNRQLWYALGFTSVVALSAFTGYFLFNNPNNQLGSLNPFASLMNMPSEEDSTVTKTEGELAVRRNEVVAKTETPAETGVVEETDDWDQEPTASEPEVSVTKEEKPAEAVNEVKAEPKPVENASAKTTKVPVTKTEAAPEKKAKSIRYYVIVNGFSVEDNASRFRDALLSTGQKGAKMLNRGSNGLIKVSVADFATLSEAEAKAKQMHAKYPAAWVFENE